MSNYINVNLIKFPRVYEWKVGSITFYFYENKLLSDTQAHTHTHVHARQAVLQKEKPQKPTSDTLVSYTNTNTHIHTHKQRRRIEALLQTQTNAFMKWFFCYKKTATTCAAHKHSAKNKKEPLTKQKNHSFTLNLCDMWERGRESERNKIGTKWKIKQNFKEI